MHRSGPLLASTLGAALIAGLAGAEPPVCPNCSPELAAMLADPTIDDNQPIPVVYRMREQVDLAAVVGNRTSKWQIVPVLVPALQALADATQDRPLGAGCTARPGLVTELTGVGARNTRSFWLPNAVVAEVPKAMVAACAARSDVAAADYDAILRLDASVPTGAGPFDSFAASRVVPAHAVGTGVRTVVGLLGTGADASHPALGPGIVRRADGTPVWRDMVAGLPVPYDDIGEGTHLLGIAVGRPPVGGAGDGAPLSVGVAPDAGWIACKAVGRDPVSVQTLKSRIYACLQWMLNPDAPGPVDTLHVPDVVLGSVVFDDPGACDPLLLDPLRVLRAARIVPVFPTGHDTVAGGAAGPDSLAWPARHPEVLSVGASAAGEIAALASTSYRGRADCRRAGDGVPPNLADRFGPQLFAPGANVRSAWPGGGWAIASGAPEAVAAAHVAGAAAVLREVARGLDVEPLVSLLERTAQGFVPGDRLSRRPGLLDLYAAVTLDDAEMTPPQTPPPAGSVTGQAAAVSVTMTNTGATTWRSAAYALLALRLPWGTAPPLPRVVAPGDRITFSWQATVPALPGTYAFQWQMARDGVPFGSPTDRVDVPVVGTDLAIYQGRSPEFASLVPGECQVTLLTFRNTGTNTWAPGAYVLREADATGWSPYGRADLLNVTRPGEIAWFTTPVCAPATSGTYDFQWLLAKNGASLGAYTPNERISVTCTNGSDLVAFAPPPGEMRAGTSATVSLTLRNDGSCAWGWGYCLRSPHAAFWNTPSACLGLFEVVAPGQTRSFALPITAPDGRQRASLGYQLTAPDGIPFGAVAATTVGIPWDFQASAGWVPAVQGANYWFYRFQVVGSGVWRKLWWGGNDWGNAIWPDHMHPTNVAVARFWKSPVAGWVRVTGGAQRRNPQACGNGVLVRLKLNDNAALQTFTILQNDWSWHPFSVAPFWVNVNDTIRFIVDPRTTDHDCDNTTLDPLVQVVPPATVGLIPSPVAVADLYDEP